MLYNQGSDWTLSEDEILHAYKSTAFARGYLLVTPHALASLRCLGRSNDTRDIKLSGLGTNTRKLKNQLLPGPSLREIESLFKQAVVEHTCGDFHFLFH